MVQMCSKHGPEMVSKLDKPWMVQLDSVLKVCQLQFNSSREKAQNISDKNFACAVLGEGAGTVQSCYKSQLSPELFRYSS